MANAVREPVASSSTYTGIPESMPRRYDDDSHRPAAGVYMTGISGYAAPETGYTMRALYSPLCVAYVVLSCETAGVQDPEDPQTCPRRGRKYEKHFGEPLQT